MYAGEPVNWAINNNKLTGVRGISGFATDRLCLASSSFRKVIFVVNVLLWVHCFRLWVATTTTHSGAASAACVHVRSAAAAVICDDVTPSRRSPSRRPASRRRRPAPSRRPSVARRRWYISRASRSWSSCRPSHLPSSWWSPASSRSSWRSPAARSSSSAGTAAAAAAPPLPATPPPPPLSPAASGSTATPPRLSPHVQLPDWRRPTSLHWTTVKRTGDDSRRQGPAHHQITAKDHRGVLVSCGRTPSSAIWEPTTSHWTKQSTWPRTVLCGGWCLRMALRTPSGACQKRRARPGLVQNAGLDYAVA